VREPMDRWPEPERGARCGGAGTEVAGGCGTGRRMLGAGSPMRGREPWWGLSRGLRCGRRMLGPAGRAGVRHSAQEARGPVRVRAQGSGFRGQQPSGGDQGHEQ
jgi:hypothetical protein